MTQENAIREIPHYAAEELPPLTELPKRQRRHAWFFDPEGFKRKYGILLIAAAAFTIYTICLSAIVAHRTEKRVTEEVTAAVTSELRAGFQQYLDQQEEAEKRANFLTGDASKQAAIQADTDTLKVLIAGYRMDGKTSPRGAKAIGWCAYARLLSGHYGKTLQEVVEQANQFEFYTKNHAVRPEDEALAEEISTAFHNGEYPDGFTTDLVFAERTADGNVVLRNSFKTDSNTIFWRYPE